LGWRELNIPFTDDAELIHETVCLYDNQSERPLFRPETSCGENRAPLIQNPLYHEQITKISFHQRFYENKYSLRRIAIFKKQLV
jgi:hypothetical protein